MNTRPIIRSLLDFEEKYRQDSRRLILKKSLFLDASSHLYKWLCPSVGPSVGPFVGPFVTNAFIKSVKWRVLLGY